MYCIKINVSTEKYVCSCDSGSFRLCERKHDATQFDSIDELIVFAKSIGLSEGDFEVVELNDDCSTESDVFGSVEKDVITFEHLAEILEEGSIGLWLRPGAKLEKGYIVVAAKPDAVKIWSPENFLGYMNWNDAKQAAADFYREWDNHCPFIDNISSEFLSKEEAEAMSKADRMTGFDYWTSTEYSSGRCWYVNSDGGLYHYSDSSSIGCCPGIWIRSCASLKGNYKNREDVITFERLHEICEECSADLALKPGDKLEEGYIIVAVKPDSVKIWSADNKLGDMVWHDADTAAKNYYHDWNADGTIPVEAISSELLSKEEAETLSQSDRTTGFYYWTSTERSSGLHWIVNSDGVFYNFYDSYSYGCCPGIWVGVDESSEDNDEEQKDVITFERLHEICEEGSADLALKPGDKLENGYIIAAVRPDSVKIWSANNNLGDMNWRDADTAAKNYYHDWNAEGTLPVEAVSSELLSKEEAESISKSDRTTGFFYWSSTEYSSVFHWSVYSDGSLDYSYDSNRFGCCPGIWVR